MTKPVINSFTTIAPLLIQQYERYLPTAFDESLSLLQKVNKIIKKLDELGLATNDVVSQWNTVMEWVMGDGLTESVSTKLDAMVADGTFDDIINGTIFLEFNTRLDDLAVNVKYFDTPSLAVAFAYTNNRKLDWGNGTTVVTDSIPNLHDIESVGSGKIQRGSDIYYVNPVDLQENKIYVSSSVGNDLNDGLSLSTSLRTIQKALDIVSKHAKGILKGKWRIVVSAGTYSHSSVETDILSENPLTIEGQDVGGHPGVPTTIISDGAGFSSYGIWMAGRVELIVKNIKITGYNGTTSSAGIYMSDSGSLTTQNVHTSGNYWGLSGQKSSIECPDGIHENNGYLPNGTGNGGAIRSLQLNQHHVGIQSAGVRTNTAIIRNNKTGVFIQENSTGHVDWCTFDTNEDAILVNVNARANLDGCLFTNNVRGVRLIGNAHAYIPSTCVFTNNQGNIIRTSGGQLNSPILFDNIDVSYSTEDQIIDTEYVNTDISNVVSQPFYTTYLKTPYWNNIVNSLSPIRKLEVKIFGTVTNNTGVEGSGTKQINMRLGGYKASVTLAITEQGDFYYVGYIYFVNPTTQYLLLEGNTHNNVKRVNRMTATNLTTADMKLTLEAQTNQVLDKVHIDVVEIKMAG
jgi:hypothetical protein